MNVTNHTKPYKIGLNNYKVGSEIYTGSDLLYRFADRLTHFLAEGWWFYQKKL